MAKFDTVGREKLRTWLEGKMNFSELARRLGTNPSTVSRWLSGEARPEPQYRQILAHLASIPESAWLTASDQATIDAAIEKGSAA
jgi:transcriptional regulator with XRE-family HTH domain